MTDLTDMWEALEAHQHIADWNDYGKAWAHMCKERTAASATAAAYAANAANAANAAAANAARWAAARKQQAHDCREALLQLETKQCQPQ